MTETRFTDSCPVIGCSYRGVHSHEEPMTAPKPDSWVDAGAAGVKAMAEENARLREALRFVWELVRTVKTTDGPSSITLIQIENVARTALAPKEGA